MIKFLRFSLVALISASFLMPCAFALGVPKKPKSYVNDYASLLSSKNRNAIENALIRYDQQTSNQIFVATFDSLEGDSLEDFSIRIAEAWKPGEAEKDNGIIFIIFKKERQLRIEVGYGLEGVLTDAIANQIIQDAVLPYFKTGDYELGIARGIQAIMQVASKEYTGLPEEGSARQELTPEQIAKLQKQSRAIALGIMILVGIFFIGDVFRYRKYAVSHNKHTHAYSFSEWFIRFAILTAVFTILFRVLFYTMLFSRGGQYGGRSGFGGFSGGGGGSFGGGGASGRW